MQGIFNDGEIRIARWGKILCRIVPRGTIPGSRQGPEARYACAPSSSTEPKIVPRGTKRTGLRGKSSEITLGALPDRARRRFCYGLRSAGPRAHLRPS